MIISISGTSGAGKSEISKSLCKQYQTYQLICFDDYDEHIVEPKNMHDWFIRGANYQEYDNPKIWEYLNGLKDQNVIFDFPFGRILKKFDLLIDVAVYLQVDTELALKRRLQRGDSNIGIDANEMNYFKEHNIQISKTCDLIVDGAKPVEKIISEIITYIYLDNKIL